MGLIAEEGGWGGGGGEGGRQGGEEGEASRLDVVFKY